MRISQLVTAVFALVLIALGLAMFLPKHLKGELHVQKITDIHDGHNEFRITLPPRPQCVRLLVGYLAPPPGDPISGSVELLFDGSNRRRTSFQASAGTTVPWLEPEGLYGLSCFAVETHLEKIIMKDGATDPFGECAATLWITNLPNGRGSVWLAYLQ